MRPAGRGSFSGGAAHPHAGVDHDRTPARLQHLHGVEVQFTDLRHDLDQRGDAGDERDERLPVSALIEVVPELRELDLNPVKVLEPGRGAVVVDARMRVGRSG